MTDIQTKYEALKNYLRELGSVAVAYSSGVDSTFLLSVAHDVLGARAIAITATSKFFPARELDEARAFCVEHDIDQIVFDVNQLEIDGVKDNPPDRCYLCKKFLFERIKAIASDNNLAHVIDGSNTDDVGDYRPGMKALVELNIISPLKHVGLSKHEIRSLSKELRLPTWDKPSFACLASRFVYGETITVEKLAMVERAEQFLIERGFRQLRVRIHDRLARIEIEPTEFDRLLKLRAELSTTFKAIGFQYVALDLQGYRTGSMNETINREDSTT